MKNLYAYLDKFGIYKAVISKDVAMGRGAKGIRVLPIQVEDNEEEFGYILKDGKPVICDVVLKQEGKDLVPKTIEDIYLGEKAPENVMAAKDLPEVMKTCLDKWGVQY